MEKIKEKRMAMERIAQLENSPNYNNVLNKLFQKSVPS